MSTGKWKRRRLIRESLRGDAFREWKSGDYTTCFQTVAKTPALSKLGQLA